MKALDKIWINTDSLNGYYMSSHPLSGEEYIRKDALLEWAKETKSALEEDNSIENNIRNGALWELEEVIYKIESL